MNPRALGMRMLIEKPKCLIVWLLRLLRLKPPAPFEEVEARALEKRQKREASHLSRQFIKQRRERASKKKRKVESLLWVVSVIGVRKALAQTHYSAAWLAVLEKAGFNAEVIAYRLREKPSKFIPDCLSETVLWNPIDTGLSDMALIEAALKEVRPTVVVCYWWSAGLLPEIRRLTKRYNSKLILNSGELPRESQIKVLENGTYRMIGLSEIGRICDGILVVSSALEEFWLQNGFDEQSILVSHTPVLPNDFAHQVPVDYTSAVYTGNLSRIEIDNLIEIVVIVRESNPDFHLTVFAEDSSDTIAHYVKKSEKMGAQNAIEWHSPVEGRALARALAGAGMLLLPRFADEQTNAGFPNKLGEYLMSGRPVVCTNISDISKRFINKRDLTIVPSGDNELFAQVVAYYLDNPDEADIIGAQGRKAILEQSDPVRLGTAFMQWAQKI